MKNYNIDEIKLYNKLTTNLVIWNLTHKKYKNIKAKK